MSPAVAAEDDSPLGLSYTLAPDLRLVYPDGLGYLAPHALRTFANARDWQRRSFGWRAWEPVTVRLKDFSDYGTGSAWSLPRNAMSFEVAPPLLAFETTASTERLYALMNHELVHVATTDAASTDDAAWRRLLGGKVSVQPQHPESLLYAYLTAPRFIAPRWYLEGAAVFLETWMVGGIGRAQGGYDEMVFRALVRDGGHFYDPLGLASRGVRVDFQAGANAYLYGTRFFTWLAYAHSPEKVIALLTRDEGSRRYYADRFEQVFGMPLEQAWVDWIAFERAFQQRNLDRVREQPITPQRQLSRTAMGSISRTYFDEASGILYGAFRMPGVVEHVGALNTRDDSYRRLGDIKKGMLYRVASFAFDAASGTAFFTNDNLAFRDLMALDVRTGEQRLLLKDARIGDLAFNPVDRSLMGVRHHDGLASLVRIPPPYTGWSVVHEFPYGVVPSDLDISPDGRRLSASVSEVNADQFVRVWELDRVLAGDLRPLSEFGFGASVPESFVFSRDGRYLYGSSYYTGVSNIFRYTVANGQVDAVSNAEVGLFRPAEMADGRLLVLSYSAEGFVPAVIEPQPLTDVSAISFLGTETVKRHPVLTTWQVPPAKAADDGEPPPRHAPYRPLEHVGFVNAYPVLQGYKSATGVGYRFNFEDPIRYAGLSVTAAWTPSTDDLPGDQRLHLDVEGRYLGWRAALAWNRSDFYDLFGPTKRGRKGYALELRHEHLLVYDEPRRLELTSELAHYGKIDTLPGAQNIGAAFERLTTADVRLDYSDLRRSLGAVDDEKGWTWTAGLGASRAGSMGAVQFRGGIDVGLPLPLAHSSVWSRTAFGATSGARGNPMASFYFGGFGNNVVDRAAVQRYREYESMPGFEIDEIGARRFARQMLEWTLPPVIFENAGLPGLHATWLRPATFASVLWTDADAPSTPRRYASVGAQLDLRLSTLHWYEMILSVGYAAGFRDSSRAGHEWMVSLRIL